METLAQTLALPTAKQTNFADMVERAFKKAPGLTGYKGTYESVIEAQFTRISAGNYTKRENLKRLLIHLYNQTCYTIIKTPDYLDVLTNMSAFGGKMVRDIESWEKKGFVAEDQLTSLIQHCFAKYPVPQFLEPAFAGDKLQYMVWYVQLGAGKSVMELSGFPVVFTKKMAHYFRLTPPEYKVEQAIRRAQALGYGATIENAEAIAWSVLSAGFENEAFWDKVIKFIAKVKQAIPLNELQIVLYYLKQLRENQPNLTMKGRTWDALLRQAEEWNAEMNRRSHFENYLEWKPADIGNFTTKINNVSYAIVQLVNSEELYTEGYDMSHCVAEYDQDCAGGESAIFSLRKYAENTVMERIATIEVDLIVKEVTQAKGKYNEYTTDEADKLIKEWADKEGLSIEYDSGCYQAQANPRPVDLENYRYVPPRYREEGVELDLVYAIKLLIYVILYAIQIIVLFKGCD